MVEDFRARMSDLRQEIDRIASQTEEMERVVQEQQVRLEEMDLIVRQRDEQLAEQQAHVEELEAALRQRDEELATLRAQLAEKDASLAEKDQELVTLRARLAEYEASEAALRDELARLQAPAPAALPLQAWIERFAVLESLVNRQSESLIALRSLIQEEMARLHSRLDQLEARLAVTPAYAPAVVEAAPPVERVPPAVVAPPVEDALHAALQEALDMLPQAALVGLAGRDGLSVETLARREPAFAQPLELGLADLATEALRVAAALNTGPLLTVAFQAGEDHLLLSPVGEDHFAYLLAPVNSPADFQQAQAVLLQTVSRINELD